MKVKALLRIFLSFFLLPLTAYSQSGNIGLFIENKGQVIDFNEAFRPEVKYYYADEVAAIYFEKHRLVYNFKKSEKIDLSLLDRSRDAFEEEMRTQKATYHRMDMVFKNAKSNSTIVPGKKGQGVTHFYLNKRNGVRDVQNYTTITYQNIYNQIDAVFYQSSKGIKYDLVLKEGADINDIELFFEGAEVKKVGEQLVLSTNHGDITEEIPLSFINGNQEEKVEVNYFIDKNGAIRFKLKKDIQFKSLTIDPVLEWGTYYNLSSGTSESLYGINNYMDNDGTLYTYGMTQNAASTYPITNPGGAFTAVAQASADAYFMKFDNNRSLVWSTYLGGSGYDEIYNTQGIVINGSTLHLVGERITSGAPFTNSGGFYQANADRNFWARFNKNTGVLQHLTSLSNAYKPSIAVSNSGIVAIMCDAYDFNNLPIVNRAGAYNQATCGGAKDMGLLMFNAGFTQIWGTFLGGPSTQEVFAGVFDAQDNLFFVGETNWYTSGANAGTPANEKLVQLAGAYYQSVPGGGTDVMLGKFSSAGQLVWNTMFGGNNSDARRGQQGSPARILLHPATNELVLAFNTTSSNLPLISLAGAYNKGVPTDPQFAGSSGSFWNYAAYISKFSTAGALNYSTYYYTQTGGGDLIENIGFGACDKFYVGSAGVSTKSLTGAAAGYNLILGTSSSRSGYISMLNSTTFAFEWDSYLNTDVSYEANVAANPNMAKFYTAAALYYQNLPTVDPGNGAFFSATSLSAAGKSLGISQFHPALPPEVDDVSTCAGSPVNLNATLGMGAPYNWYDSQASTTILATGSTYTVSPATTTTYYVSSGTGQCASPKVPVIVTVTPSASNPTFTGPATTCAGNSVTLTVNNPNPATTYTLYTGSCTTGTAVGTGTSFNVSPAATTTYYLSFVNDCGTNDCLNHVVTVTSPEGGTAASSSAAFCGTGSTTLTLTGHTGDIQWQQSTDGGTTWTNVAGANVTPFTVNNITVTTIYRAELSSAGCTSDFSNTVTVTNTPSAAPSVTISGAPASNICSGTSVTFTANPTNGGTAPTYEWQINGVAVSGQTSSTFTSTTLANNDQVTVVMTSNDPCASVPTAISAASVIQVGGTITPSVAITGVPASSICSGSSVTFTANPTNGGTAPTYQWQVNGVAVSAQTSSTFTSTTLANNDQVTVVMTSNDPCASVPTAISAASVIQVGGTITPSVAITGAPASSICSGSSVTFTANPTNGGTAPTYQWQVNGVAVSGQTSSTFTSTTLANNDQVTVVMTSNDPCASVPTATSAASVIQVGGTVTPSVTITGAPASSICSGSSVTFTANPTNGGTAPTYQWQVNGVAVSGQTSSTFTTTTLANNDQVTVVMTSNDPCASVPTATSAAAVIQVGGTITPSVTISGAPTSSICSGSSVTFTANPTNGGTAPTYQWQVNGVAVSGQTSSTFTSTTLANNDQVTVVMTSNDPCASVPTATSAAAVIQVGGTITPSVTISGAPTSSICSGSSVTFTANPTNGGTAPTYQWRINGVAVSGQTSSTFTSTTLANNDQVTVVMTSNDPCASVPAATSAAAVIQVGGTITPSVTISGAPTSSICSGSSVTFTANPTNGGTAPTYQWQVNGVAVSGQTSSTFTSTTLANNDQVTVVMTSNDPCASVPTATSAAAVIQVGGTITPSVTISGAPTSSICSGTSVTFTANPTNGGTAPTYQWQINGVNVAGATSATFTTTALNNTDVVTVTMVSNATCASVTPASASTNPLPVNPVLVINATSTNTNCTIPNGGTATAAVSGGTPTYTYAWAPSGGSNATATNLSAGIYTVTVTDNAGCTAAASTTISGSTPIVLTTSGTPVNCGSKDGTATATATGGTGMLSYVWVPGNMTTPVISNLSAGNYTVTVTDANGCSASVTQAVVQNGSLNISANPYSTEILEGGSVDLEATINPSIPGTIFTWTPSSGLSCTNCPKPVASPNQTTIYTVTAVTPDGCTADTNVTVQVKRVCGNFFIPTIFSPNGDGENDTFKVFGKCIDELRLTVYDRWGEKVFETYDAEGEWDGYFKGEIMNTGIFVYVAEFKFAGDSQVIKGNLTLVR